MTDKELIDNESQNSVYAMERTQSGVSEDVQVSDMSLVEEEVSKPTIKILEYSECS